MKTLVPSWGINLSIGKFAVLVTAVAVIGNILMTHQASATFFAARGETKVYGVDRLTGVTSTPANPADKLYIFPNDAQKVGWKASVWNSGDLGNQQPWLPSGTTVTVKHRYFDGTSSNGSAAKPHALQQKGVNYYDRPQLEPLLIALAASDYYFARYPSLIADGSNKDWFPPVITLSGTGSTTPGKQYCQYASANPAGYNIIPYVGSYNFPWPGAYGNVNFTGSHMACAEVAYNYNLIPKIESITASGGADTVTTSSVNQPAPGGDATKSQPSQWQITQVILRTGTTVPADFMAGADTQTPCNGNGTVGGTAGRYKPAGNIQYCRVVAKSGSTNSVTYNTDGSWSTDSKGGVSPNSVSAPTSGQGQPATGIVCYVYSISSYKPVYPSLPNPSNTSPYVKVATWNNSAMYCPPIPPDRKSPAVHILGDDVRVGGKVVTYQTEKAAKLFGSWGEYAAYVGGTVGLTSPPASDIKNPSFFSTGAGSRGGTVDAPLTYNSLTFANNLGAATTPKFGSFATPAHINSVTGMTLDYFKQNAKPLNGVSSINLSDAPYSNGTTTTHSTGATPTSLATPFVVDNASGAPFTITGGAIPRGRTVIIVATGTVKITGDITYDSGMIKKLDDLPQVVIVAHDILIADNVRNIDAWLLANMVSGTIDTCDGASAKITGGAFMQNDCNKQLQVNGPVATNKLLLHRTAGAEDGDLDQPAETFNNRGDAYLWALRYATDDRNLTTTKMVELPPRY